MTESELAHLRARWNEVLKDFESGAIDEEEARKSLLALGVEEALVNEALWIAAGGDDVIIGEDEG